MLRIAVQYPAYGQLRAANKLRKEGISSIRAGYVRCGCATTWRPSRNGSRSWKPRWLRQEGIILTENQLAALEKAKQEKEAYGEIETEHPDPAT